MNSMINTQTWLVTFCLINIFFMNPIRIFAQLYSSVYVTESLEFTSSNLPIVVIETHEQTIADRYRIVADMGIIYNENGQRNHLTDSFNNYDGRIAIELRGSSSMSYPKNQYRLETQDSTGENLNVSLLGFPEENDWIFYGPYDDRSLIRNVLAYKLSNDMGRYASRTCFCELVLNGNYRGLYVLMEKIKRDRNRVSVTRIDSLDIGGDALTGGYIIKIDKREGENVDGWRSVRSINYQYHYPKPREIVTEQEYYIRNYMNRFESVMAGTKISDPNNGYPSYIDVESFVDHFIISEFCKNVDAYRISTFMSKDRDSKGGKLTAGPIWDFNLSLGKAWYAEDLYLTDRWEVDHNYNRPGDSPKVPFWWEKLGHDKDFANLAETRWRDLRNGLFRKDSLYSIIDHLVDFLTEARIRNFERWPESGNTTNYNEEIEILKQWISDRIDWIDDNIGNLNSNQHISETDDIPPWFTVEQNFPNPFNAITKIRFGLPKPANVKVEIYDICGQKVLTLLDSRKTAGYHVLEFDGASLPSSVYLYRIRTNIFDDVKKMTLLK